MCKELGYPHPDYLLDSLTAGQIAEWEAYSQLEPIGEERIEFSFAVLASLIANVALSAFGKKGTKRTTPMDFLPQWDVREEIPEEKPRQSIEEMKAVLESIAAHSGKRKKKGR